jgi:hypothetical protein
VEAGFTTGVGRAPRERVVRAGHVEAVEWEVEAAKQRLGADKWEVAHASMTTRQGARAHQNCSNWGRERRFRSLKVPARPAIAISNTFLARSDCDRYRGHGWAPGALAISKLLVREGSIPLIEAVTALRAAQLNASALGFHPHSDQTLFSFSESFQLIVAPGEERWEGDDFAAGVINEVIAALDDIAGEASEIRHEVTSIGRGASGIALLLVLTGIFLSGKNIEENLEAWIRLATRLGASLKKLRSLAGPVYLSEPAAAPLAFRAVLDRAPSPRSVRLTGSSILVVDPATIGEQFHHVFQYVPERFYLYTFVVDDGDSHVVCIRSSGEIEFHHVLPTGNWLKYLGYE